MGPCAGQLLRQPGAAQWQHAGRDAPVSPQQKHDWLTRWSMGGSRADENPGTCRCVELKAAFTDQEQTAMDIFNEDKVEETYCNFALRIYYCTLDQGFLS